MEQMAKAQRDRMKKELEDKLRESGDLPPEEDAPKVRKTMRFPPLKLLYHLETIEGVPL